MNEEKQLNQNDTKRQAAVDRLFRERIALKAMDWKREDLYEREGK